MKRKSDEPSDGAPAAKRLAPASASASAEATGAAATGAAATGAEASASTEPPAGATGALAPAEAAGEAEEGGAAAQLRRQVAAKAELRFKTPAQRLSEELQTPGDVLAGGKAEKDASQDVEMTVKDPSAKKFKMKKDNTDLQSRAEVASRWVIWNPDKARPSKDVELIESDEISEAIESVWCDVFTVCVRCL